jgi:recombinational DNA repair protein (RecF pathway)
VTATTDRICVHCKEPGGPGALRPYGKDGALVCFACAMLPENEAQTEASLQAIFDAEPGAPMMLTDDGPVPILGGRH